MSFILALYSVVGWPQFQYTRGLGVSRQDSIAETPVLFPGGQNTNLSVILIS